MTDFALSDFYAIGDLFYPLWNLLQLSATGNLACQTAMLVAHLRKAMWSDNNLIDWRIKKIA